MTCNSLLLSYLHYLCISKFGIFSIAHRLAVAGSRTRCCCELSARRSAVRREPPPPPLTIRVSTESLREPLRRRDPSGCEAGERQVSRNSIVTGISLTPSACQAFRPLAPNRRERAGSM